MALFFSLILLPVDITPLAISSAAAKSPFSIPGLRTLKRKLGLQKRRYRRKRNRRNRNRKINPALAAPNNGKTQEHLAPPPLPVRNPRHLARSRNKSRRLQKAPLKQTRWKKRQSKQKTRPSLQRTRDNTASAALPPLPTRKPYLPPSKIKEPDWTQSTIDEAVSQCTQLGINLPLLPPAKKGRCGNPAPVLLANIGGLSKQVYGDVSIRPAATLSCPMISSLRQWLARSVQPLAQKHFGKPVRQIRNISSYVCRNRYDYTKTKISEHAFANALDIAWFELEGGMKISLLTDWDSPDQDKASFLHELHTSACKYFGTVLGPNANAAHKNHFHLDRAPRRRSNYCR
ncbi:MAG: extensin family protein [Hyphomicrobiaceae bacterium]|nr:extensin family protein [Hyphomicrobiaceae bacterium]